VIHGNLKFASDDGRQSTVRVSENEHTVWPVFEKERLDAGQYLPHLNAETGAINFQEYVGTADIEFSEKIATKAIVVVLTGVHENVFGMLIKQPNDQAKADNLRTRPEDGHHFQRRTSTESRCAPSGIKPSRRSRREVSSSDIILSAELNSFDRHADTFCIACNSGNIGSIT
jgi:hypothetical protein